MIESPIKRVDAQYLEKRLGVHRNTFQRWADANQFPRPHTLGTTKKRLWLLHEVEDWETKQMANPNNSAA